METIDCIVCNSNTNVKVNNFNIGKGNSFTLVKCKCDLIFLNPRPDINSIKKYYDSQYLSNKERNSFYYKSLQKISFNWKYRLIKSIFSNNNGTLLDIGGGDSSFSDFICRKNWTAYSYDINNNKFTLPDLLRLKDNSIDLITLWHSIEHFHNINEIFTIIKNKLKPNGYLMVACPNVNAAEISILKNNWVAYDIPRHLYHFTPDTLNSYIKKFSFSIISKKIMYQDIIFNIFLSLRNYNLVLRLFYFIFIFFYSLTNIFFNTDKSSSYTYICKKQ